MAPVIHFEAEDHIAVLTIDRPEVMNSLHPMASEEMSRVLDDFVADSELWVAIITGAGDRAFSAGNDLKYTAAGGKFELPPTGFAGLTQRFDNWKPIIAAVNGVALGGGFELVLACDLIIAAEEASFALPEPRVGLMAAAGGVNQADNVSPHLAGQERQLFDIVLKAWRVPLPGPISAANVCGECGQRLPPPNRHFYINRGSRESGRDFGAKIISLPHWYV